MATDLLADYAAELPKVLAEAIQYADSSQFAIFYDLLSRHKEEAVSELKRFLAEELKINWQDAPLDLAWDTPDPSIGKRIEAAHGLITERFALCQTLPLHEFQEISRQLEPSGYRPEQIRPYTVVSNRQVAAVWSRDGLPWDWKAGAADEIRNYDRELRGSGYQPTDVTGFTVSAEGDTTLPQFAALWVKTEESSMPRRLLVGIPSEDIDAAIESLQNEGYKQRLRYSVLPRDGAQRLVCALLAESEVTQEVYSQPGSEYSGELHLGLLQVDLELSRSSDMDRHYTALWEESSDFESAEIHGLGPAEQLGRGRELIKKGYRPILMDAVGESPDSLVTASLWRRPLIAEADKDSLAKRQANTAVAMLKLGQVDLVWPLFSHGPDPRLRSYLIHLLCPLGADPSILIGRLDREPDVSVRRALLLCLGEYQDQVLPEDTRQALVPKLLELYRTHPDAGLHATAEWLLRQWGQGKTLVEIRQSLGENEAQLRDRTAEDRRQWYVTTQGHTMVFVDGGEFLMGSPPTDPDRDRDETLHRRRIGRRFAISATEVTREQYSRFQQESQDDEMDLVNQPHVVEVVRTDDSPIAGTTWYEAAAYCNWLSEKEGIPPDQWCYQRNDEGKFGPGMRPKENYLSLGGYRLPSEAEWQFACRAGAVTRHYYGHSDALLGEYGWYEGNAEKRTWPVGMLKPNDFGLFDMHGNVGVWCHNRSTSYGDTTDDVEDDLPVEDTDIRLVLGGTFGDRPRNLRCANRLTMLPPARNVYVGIRPARTWQNPQ
jgi:formylglycine-generating enzyme required for sulfatase activity